VDYIEIARLFACVRACVRARLSKARLKENLLYQNVTFYRLYDSFLLRSGHDS